MVNGISDATPPRKGNQEADDSMVVMAGHSNDDSIMNMADVVIDTTPTDEIISNVIVGVRTQSRVSIIPNNDQ